VTASRYRPFQQADVALPVNWTGQEVERGAIVPHAKCPDIIGCPHVGHDPAHKSGTVPKPLLRSVDCGGGDIQNRNGVTVIQ